MDEPADTFCIYVDYEDDELQDQIEQGSTQALGWIRGIRTAESVMIGGDDSSGMREYLTGFFGGVTQCLVEALRGDRSHFTAGNGPVYVVLEPEGEESVRVTFAYKQESIAVPEAREPFEPSVVVYVDPLVTEVLESAEEFLAHVTEWNPDLAKTSSAYRGLREDIGALQEAYEEW